MLLLRLNKSDMALLPVQPTTADKDQIDDFVPAIDALEWEDGEYTFSGFVDFFRMPQIIKVEQKWHTDFTKDQYVVLHSLFERYAIVAKPLGISGQALILSDWFAGDCKILTPNPVLKRRWWVFQGAFELYRFELPREIKVLAETPSHFRRAGDSTSEWKKVIIKKDHILKAVRKSNYKSKNVNEMGEFVIAEPKEGFVLTDHQGNEFLVPPSVPFRFSTKIKDNELHDGYMKSDGRFCVSELLMRYEFPLDIELFDAIENGGASIGKYQLSKYCVLKSIMAVTAGAHREPHLMELSPSLQFTLHCPRCLTYNLPRDGQKPEKEEVNKDEVYKYSKLCNDVFTQLNPLIEKAKVQIRAGAPDEIASVEQAYDISAKMEADQKTKATTGICYCSPEDAGKVIADSGPENFVQAQPKSFTVHACVDKNNPYNEAIEYEVSDNAETGQNGTPQLKETFVMHSNAHADIPKEAFEAAVKSIPEVLILDN